MNILFLIGNEGTGHHLFESFCSYKQNPSLHGLLASYFSNEATPSRKSELRIKIEEFSKENPLLNHIERASFPHFRPLNCLQRHDIKEFYDLFKNNSDVNLFFVVCLRDIVHSTLSAWKRFDTFSSIALTAKTQEDSLIYINSQMQLLPEDGFLVAEYNSICQNVKGFEKIFKAKSRMKDIVFDPRGVHPSSANHDDHHHAPFLRNFFDRKRLSQFSFLQSKIEKF